MPTITHEGVNAWACTPSEPGDYPGFCITNTSSEGTPSVTIYIDKEEVVGLVVYEDDERVGMWGLVPATELKYA